MSRKTARPTKNLKPCSSKHEAVPAPSDVHSLQVWGGPGQGAPCDLCRNEIGPGEVDYEVEAIVDGQPRALHFHIRCFELWKTGTDAA
ncbi:MAG: hypothetical protein DIU56_014470 [Pseudomonadota bacterium]|jgi:hypothetical protein|nr:MAG: hypothetical protein DIU56_07745 [Pseudomonadota bacterium]